MKNVFLLLTIAFVFTGCFSKIPQELVLPDYQFSETAKEVGRQYNFSMTIPEEDKLFLQDEQNGARLFQVASNQTIREGMTIEQYPLSLETAVNDVTSRDGIQKLSDEELTINGLNTRKLIVELEGQLVTEPMYFIEANESTFLFRLVDGKIYEPFEAVVNSFSLDSAS